MRIRKGRRGLFFTDGVLDNCSWNNYHASLLQLCIRWYRRYSIRSLLGLLSAIENGILALLGIILFPIAPIIVSLRSRYKASTKLTDEEKKQRFNKTYYEVVSE